MKINVIALVISAMSAVVGVTFVLVFMFQHAPRDPVALHPEETAVEQVQLLLPHPAAWHPEETAIKQAQFSLPTQEETPSNDPMVKYLPEKVEEESPNTDSVEIITQENQEKDPVFVDNVEIPSSLEERERELTHIFFDVDLTDEKIDEIFETIRAGTEENREAFDPSNDYPDRITFILRLLKQTAMNAAEITSMIQDVFPPRVNTFAN